MMLVGVLFACEEKKDDSSTENPTTESQIVGTWGSLDAGVRTYEDGKLEDDITSQDTLTLVLNSDNSFTYSGKYQQYDKGTYTTDNQKLMLNGDKEQKTMEVKLLTADRLMLLYVEEYSKLGVDIRDEYYYDYKKK